MVKSGDIGDGDKGYDNADGLKRNEVNAARTNEQSKAAGDERVEKFCAWVVSLLKDHVEEWRAVEEECESDGHEGKCDGEQ